MIYFDNGATTLQKPPEVARAMAAAVGACANPGRSGHRPALKAARVLYSCREAVCHLFSWNAPEQVVLTLNTTHALNIALKSLLHDGGHAVISGYEHNSVVRPLKAMEGRGVTFTAAASPLFEPEAALRAIEAAITGQTRCVILNHVSNVFGFVLPLDRVDALCRARGLPLVIDAAQSAGVLGLNLSRLKSAAFVCMPGHKGLYGPQGTGILICCKDNDLYSLMEGGTGSNSLEMTQPDFLPDLFESGTANVPGAAGLLEGLRFVIKQGTAAILGHERRLTDRLARGLANLPGVQVYHRPDCQAGVVSFQVAGAEPEAVAEALAERDICVRSGLHCAPLAHQSAGTLPQGTVRASFSAFNTDREVDRFAAALHRLLPSLNR